MKKIVISGYHGFNNAGDEVILASILRQLRQEAAARGISLEIVVLSANPEMTRRTDDVQSVGRTNPIAILRALRHCDLFISGGGSLLQDKTGYGLSVFYYLGIACLAHRLGIPTMLYAHGIGPISRSLNRRFARWAVNKIDYVSVRDNESRDELLALGFTRPITVTVDPAFFLRPDQEDGNKNVSAIISRVSNGGPLVGVCIREWQGDRAFPAEMARAVDRLAAELEAAILFIPMFPQKDLLISHTVAALMHREAVVLEDELEPGALLFLFSHLDMLVGVRLHSLIFAAMAGVPMVGIDYDPKVDAFLKQFQMKAAGRLETIRSGELLEHCMQAWQERETTRQRLQNSVEDFRQEAARFGKAVFNHFFAQGAAPNPKVLHLISGGDTGGAKTHVLSLIRELRQHIDVTLVCFMEGEFSRDARNMGLDIRVIPQKQRYDLGVLKGLRQMIGAEGFNVLHCHGARANFVASILRRSVRLPAMTTMHSDYRLDFQGSFYKNLVYTTLNAWALRGFDYYFAVSDNFSEMLVSRGFPEHKIFVIYNGIDFTATAVTCNREGFFREAGLDIPPEAPVVGIMGRLHPVKDHALFLRGAKAVLEQAPETHFLVAGDGDDKKKLVQLRDQLRLTERVHFLGHVDDPDNFMHALTINTLTSRSESFPLVLLEGARQKKPTVSADVGGVELLIRHGETGLLFPAGDTAAFAERVLNLLRDGETAQQLGENLYKHARDHFSLERLGDEHIRIYRQVLGNNRRKRRGKRFEDHR